MPAFASLVLMVPDALMVAHTSAECAWPSTTSLDKLLTLAPLYYIFIAQTRSYHFARTTRWGGADYFKTSRAVSIAHMPLHGVWMSYARSLFIRLPIFCCSCSLHSRSTPLQRLPTSSGCFGSSALPSSTSRSCTIRTPFTSARCVATFTCGRPGCRAPRRWRRQRSRAFPSLQLPLLHLRLISALRRRRRGAGREARRRRQRQRRQRRRRRRRRRRQRRRRRRQRRRPTHGPRGGTAAPRRRRSTAPRARRPSASC